ncbi:MAG: carbon storage regulator [Planctomycetaceae bacterium]|nr:carbon storage regulator [Planctomycetaceae bacterium]
MLVLTRKQGEMVRIGDNIVIKVISTGRGKTKIGIEAPGDVRVLRAELAELLLRNDSLVEVVDSSATLAHS